MAEARVGVAAADVVDAAPWLPSDPELNLGGGARFGGGQDGADLSIGLSQPLELFGQQGLRRQLANRAVAAGSADADVVRFLVHRIVHQAFHTALVAEAEVAAAHDGLAFATRLLEVAHTRVQAGETSSLTVRLARISLARAREQVLTATEAQNAARLQLGRAAGYDDTTGVRPATSLATSATPGTLPAVDELLALAREQQPLLRAQRARLAAAEAKVQLSAREGVPTPVLGAGYAVEGLAPSSTQTQQIVGISLAMPLPLVRGNDAARARDLAERDVAAAALNGEERRLASELLQTWNHANTARQRILLFVQDILPELDETLSQLELAFTLGELDLTEVMVGREQALTARREALTAWGTWFESRAALEAIVGAELPSLSTPTSGSPSPSSASTPSTDRGAP